VHREVIWRTRFERLGTFVQVVEAEQQEDEATKQQGAAEPVDVR